MKTRCRIIHDPWSDNVRRWRPQRRRCFIWFNFPDGGGVYGGSWALRVESFDEAKDIIANFRKAKAEVPL